MENVTLNQKEQARLQILNSLLSEHMTVDQAATLMGVSTRHTWRLLAAYRKDGAAALAHGHRGRRAPNTGFALKLTTLWAGWDSAHKVCPTACPKSHVRS